MEEYDTVTIFNKVKNAQLDDFKGFLSNIMLKSVDARKKI